MKLSQRLTRAGLTFILLGSVAAVMPQQNESVQAADCPNTLSSGIKTGISDGSATNYDSYTLTDQPRSLYTNYYSTTGGTTTTTSVIPSAVSVSVATGIIKVGSKNYPVGTADAYTGAKTYGVQIGDSAPTTSSSNTGTVTFSYTTTVAGDSQPRTYMHSISLSGPA